MTKTIMILIVVFGMVVVAVYAPWASLLIAAIGMLAGLLVGFAVGSLTPSYDDRPRRAAPVVYVVDDTANTDSSGALVAVRR